MPTDGPARTGVARAGVARAGVVERAFTVLAAFDERHLALSLTQITNRTGLPLNTARRLILNLVDAGALERRDDGLYVVGLRLFEVAALGPRIHGLRRLAMTALQDLRAVTEHHILLTVRQDDEAVLVERLSSRRADRVAYRIGGRLPLDGTGGGLVLLAHAPIDVQQRLIDRVGSSPRGDGGNLFEEKADLRRRLSAIRLEGVLAISGPPDVDRGAVAAPIFGGGGGGGGGAGAGREVVAAVSVVAAADPRTLAALEPAVRLTARTISAAISRRGG